MKNMVIFLLILIIFLTGVFIYAAVVEDEHLVIKIIDGDTFTIRNGNTIRLIGIDAPEKGAYHYEESKARLAELIQNKSVTLERDKSDKDRYGRLLRYVYFNGTFINIKMAEEGFAAAAPYDPDIKFRDEIQAAENTAKGVSSAAWAGELTENTACTLLGCGIGSNYVGSINSDKYHECESRFAKMIAAENIICFRTEQEAVDSGYIKSG